jgi:hypothetical protein
MGKKMVSSPNLLLPRQEIFLCGDILQRQYVMLINGRILVLFYPHLLGGKPS